MAEKIVAPLSGKIIKINVTPGASVAEDDEILVIEAMKMETLVYAPCDGTVEKIHVAVGDDVEEDDLLLTVETS